MSWNSHAGRLIAADSGQRHVAASLPEELISIATTQQHGQVRARHVARQPQTAMASSLTKCSLTTFSSPASPKWQATASLTIAFRSVRSSPCVKML